MPTEQEATEFFPITDPWEVWFGGKPKLMVEGSIGRTKTRVGYILITLDVSVKADDLVKFELDDQEFPMAMIQQTRGSMIAHTGCGKLLGIELKTSDSQGQMNGQVVFEINRIKRLMDRVIPAQNG